MIWKPDDKFDGRWRRWFAWRPVWIGAGEHKAWLITVEYRYVGCQRFFYRLPKGPRHAG